MDSNYFIKGKPNQNIKDDFTKEVVTDQHDFQNTDSYEYIECTPLLLGIGNEPELDLSEKDITADQKLHCPSCEYKTRRRDLLLSHTMLHEKELSSSSSTSSLNNKGHLQTACSFTMLQRGEQFFYKCIRCFYLTTAWAEIKRHVRRKHTGDSEYGCDWCTEYTSPNLAHLKVHVERHHWQKLPYQCDYCKFTAWRLREYQMHKLKHYTLADEMPCSVCGAELSNRKISINNVIGRSAIFCKDCNKWFNNSTNEFRKNKDACKTTNQGRKTRVKR